MPAYNEEDAVGQVIEAIREEVDIPIMIIDDGSTDNTVAIARSLGALVVCLPAHLGAWGATQTGLRYAQRHGYDLAISMDADGQHEAQSLPALIAPVREGLADVSIGACTERGSLMRKVAWQLMKKVSGLSLDDITSGFRVYNARAIAELSRRRATLLDYQDIGVLLLLQSRGLKIVDVEVSMQPRLNGPSRVFHSWLMIAYYMSHTLLLGLTKRRFTR